jgi:twitching motility protein PilT
MPNINNFLQYAVSMGASDLHLSCGSVPLMRVHGELRPLKWNVLDAKETLQLIAEVLTPEQQRIFSKQLDLDFCYEAPNIGSFRANILKQRNGVDAVFRIIPTEIRPLENLGLPRTVKELTHHHHGLVLVTGSAGNGKSTTLAAMIDHINSRRRLHIITVEDPIEFVHPPKQANISQREIKSHTESFSTALRASLREDPDVILIGELRDLETISMAITAAETGHLVFGTLHTRTAAKTIDRIIDVFPANQQNQIRTQLSETLRGVISQQLIPRADGKGRVVAYEILVGTPAVSNLIREGKTFQIPSLMQIGAKDGMCLMDQCLSRLLTERMITEEEAMYRTENKRLLAAAQKSAAGNGGVKNG